MKLKNQVVSLELAKELKKKGYPQEGLCFWHFDEDICPEPHINTHKDGNNAVAPTVAELGCMLPSYISQLGEYNIERIKTEKNGGHFRCYFLESEKTGKATVTGIREFTEAKEADARAKMWLYLKKNNLLNQDEVKK